ncbi:MAG TPA: hypothetical protein VND64_33160, partial [Pirellulales bacterium]|nr:hypothetical protein [Pirellulales bacterium]
MFRFEAEASGIGAGGVGAESPPAAGAAAPPCPPQQLSPQQLLQPELQLLRHPKSREKSPQRFLQHEVLQLLQQLSQALLQAGSQQAGSQQAGSQQAGSQQAGSQQLLLPHDLRQPKSREKSPQRFLQQVLQPLLHESQQAGSQQAG